MFAATGCHHNSFNDEIRQSGCSEGVQLIAEATIARDKPDTVFLAIRATNRSSGFRSVEISQVGKCGTSVAFATGRGKATRVWRLESPPVKQPPGVAEVCAGSVRMVGFGPGSSVYSFRAAVPVRTILGDSLPPGLYRAVIGADSRLRGGLVTPEIGLR
jgi:hypothetical protein